MQIMDDQPREGDATEPGEHLLDPSYWLEFGQEALQGDRPQEALEACRRAVLLLPDMAQLYTLMLDAADRVRDQPTARVAVSQLIRLRPQEGALILRHAETLSAGGQTDQSVLHLHSILEQEPAALWPYVTALAASGRYTELLACQPLLDHRAHPPPMPFGPYALLALAKLAAGLDRREIQRVIAGLEASAAWLQPEALPDRLRQAIAERRPFSFVQVDEAECRFLCYASPRAHLVLRPHEASTMADASWQAWSGDTITSAGEARIALLGRDVLLAIDQADLCGIADAEVMALDNYHFGFLGEVQRLILRNDGRCYTSSRVLPMLHRICPFLRELLADQAFLGLVSAHPDLAGRLGRFANITETTSYLVPDIRATVGGALLDWHQQNLEIMTVPFPGAIFLVSAGVFGKLWCARIKTLGGIAIEIGSLAEHWATQQGHWPIQ